MKWEKIDRSVNNEGTTITYAAEGLGRRLLIQSRKRHIPHANGSGTWDRTNYWIMLDGAGCMTARTLKEAKSAAEHLAIRLGIVGPEI